MYQFGYDEEEQQGMSDSSSSSDSSIISASEIDKEIAAHERQEERRPDIEEELNGPGQVGKDAGTGLYPDDEDYEVGMEMLSLEEFKSGSLDEAKELILNASRRSVEQSLRPPLADSPAEIIVVTTSLRGAVHSYFDSVRMMHFLNCKGLVWLCVDTNKDVITSRNLDSSRLLQEWQDGGILKVTVEGKISVPQCIIDGVSVGDDIELLALEQDQDLDHIVNRDRCPKCLEERDRQAGQCYYCNIPYKPLINPSSDKVVRMFAWEEVGKEFEPNQYTPPGNHLTFRPLEELKNTVTF